MTGLGGGGGGGGGSGDAGGSIVTLTNETGWAKINVAKDIDVILSLQWSSIEDGNETGDGSLQVSVNSLTREIRQIPQGSFTVNVKDYLSTGNNRIAITVTDINGKYKTKNFLITVEQLVINSNFDSSIIRQGPVTFTFTPYGAFTKIIHFKLDQNELETMTTSISGRQMSAIIPVQAHGPHTLKVWFTAEIGEASIPSNELVYDIMWVAEGNNTPIISSNFNQTATTQYSTITVPFIVYTPDNPMSQVTIKMDGKVISTLTDVDRTTHDIQFRMDEEGTHTITIQSGSASKEFTIEVEESEIDVEAETDSLALYLSSTGRSNLEENPATWKYNNIESKLTGFNFVSNGWIIDKNGQTALRINNGAYLTIPYKPFSTDFRETGKTIEIEFAVRDVQNYNVPIVSCMSGGRGLNITPQFATLKSEQSEVTMQFKDEEHVRLTFVCEKRNEDRLLLAYVDAIPSGVIQYPTDDDFSQIDPATIRIGNNTCTVDIYCIRVYDNNLTHTQVMHNWIADTQDGSEMLARYSRNNIYDAYGQIVIDKLPSNLPYMVLQCPELPQYKGDKKIITGYYTDPTNPSKSFTFENCQINVQGTSSAPYARKNYDMQFKGGFTIGNKNEKNYTLAPGIIPFNRFVVKADVASSEGANNVELVKLYCDISPYKTREMEADPRVRQGIYGFPIVIFWTNTDTGETSFLGKYNFNLPKRAPEPYGYSGNMESWEFQNNTSNLMLFKSDFFDTTMREDPETGEAKEAWRYDYEARFPSDEWTNFDTIQELEIFVVSTDRTKATGNSLDTSVTYGDVTYTNDTAEYRLAKFREEFPTYAELDSFLFYYIFTELFLMVDSRAKNLFIGFSGSDVTTPGRIATRKAVAEPYDMDTALGTNNEGSLVFSYNLEDVDHTAGGADVFNGQTSVLWNNIRDAYPDKITSMYQNLRSNSLLSYDAIENRFETHQAMWPEAIWQEDSWFKYIIPLTDPDPGKQPTDAYLDMMQGSKLQQRKWWLSNRFKYMDSKWNSGDALADVIQFRAYNTASMTVTPYSDLYVTVKYGSYTGKERAAAGQVVPMPVPVDSLSDTEIYVYSAPQIADVGDLSPFIPGWADFSKATRIQKIKIGDASENYNNGNFTRLSLGNNRLLKLLDVRNCSALGTGPQKTVDLSGCINLEEIYFDGTAISGVTLADTGIVRILHLPVTITNLTLINQTKITDFTCPDYSNIQTLRIENPAEAINIFNILNSMADGSRVRLYNFHWELTSLTELADIYEKLDKMRGLDQNGNNMDRAQLYGTVHVQATTGADLAVVEGRYPGVTITYDEIVSNLYYYDFYGNTLLHTDIIANNGSGSWQDTPSKPSDTAQYTFGNFQGWSLQKESAVASPNATRNITGDRKVYAAFTVSVRTYTVTFKYDALHGNNGTLYTQYNVPYGGTPVYGGSTPTSSQGEDYVFDSWTPAIGPITGATTYIAVFRDTSLPLYKYLKRNITAYESNEVTAIGQYAFQDMTTLESIVASASNIGQYAFSGCPNLTLVDLTNVGSVGIANNAFEADTKLAHLIIRSSQVASLSSTNALNRTKIASGVGAIYVPASLVDTYKTTSPWSTYKDNIFPISAYPKTDFSTITDTWTEIKSHMDSGDYATRYSVGDTKLLTLNDANNTQVYMQLAAIDGDTKASGGTAKMTWLCKNIYTTHRMNASATTSGGWADTEMRSWLADTVFGYIPEEVRNNIVEVTKSSWDINTSAEISTNDKIWIPSCQEVNFITTENDHREENGITYTGLFPNQHNNSAANRVKYLDSSACEWWLRSSYSSSRFMIVYGSGSVGYYGAANTFCGVVFGFACS